MDDVARTVVAEDRVVLILAVDREAARSALLVADELLGAEVPAPRTLVDVAADRPLVANLRRADFDRRRVDGGIQAADLLILEEVDDLDRRADLQSAVRQRRHG